MQRFGTRLADVLHRGDPAEEGDVDRQRERELGVNENNISSLQALLRP